MATAKLKNKALTLIELLIAIVLVGIVVVGFSSAFSYSRVFNISKQNEITAADFCKETMEFLSMKPYNDPDIDIPVGQTSKEYDESAKTFLRLVDQNGANLEFKTKYNASRKYSLSYFKEGADTIGEEITVTVSWTEKDTKQEQLYNLIVEL